MTSDGNGWSAGSLRELAILAFVIALLAIITIFLGWPSPDHGGWPEHPDRSIWLDAAWRVALGQIPHRDFISPIGAAWLYLNSVPVVLFGPGYTSLPYGVALVMAVAMVATWHIIRPSAGRLYAILALLYVHKLFFQSQFLDYNEIALFLVMVVLITALAPDRARSRTFGAYCGIATALLLFWKLNFFGAAISVVAVSSLLYERHSSWYVSYFLSVFVVSIVWCFAIDWSISNMIVQYRIPAEIKGKRAILNALSIKKQAQVTVALIGYVVMSAVLFWLGKVFRPQERAILSQNGRTYAFFFVAMLALQNALCITNASLWAPHMVSWGVLLVGIWISSVELEVGGLEAKKQSAKKVHAIGATILVGLLWVNTATPKIANAENVFAVQNSPLDMMQKSYAVSVADGVRLIRKNALDNRRIGGLAYANPFPALLGSQPPRHVPLWWSVYDSVNINSPPSAQSVMSEVDVLMEPKWQVNEHARTQTTYLKKFYGNYVATHYKIVDEDEYWIVWVRES